MGYTIQKIQQEMTAAGSHWWDRDTMRWFKCRVGEQVYEGAGGIYFVSSEKGPSERRLYSVRQYKPETKDIGTVGEFNSMSRSAAHRLAAKMAGPEATVTREAYCEPTAAEQLAIDIQRGGGRCSATSAAHLIRLASKYTAQMVGWCNGTYSPYDENEEETPEHLKLCQAIEEAAKSCLCGVKLGGDPRGCVVKLVLPNGETNDWGKEGWCVPTRD